MKNKKHIPDFDVKIIGEISEYTLSSFIESCKGKKVINVLLHSSGGDSESAYSMVEYAKLAGIQMNVYCSKVESAALVILSHAKNKYAFKNCCFMVHLGVAGDGKVEHHFKHFKKVNYFNSLYKKLVPKSIKLTHDPEYFFASEALKLKIIDKIL